MENNARQEKFDIKATVIVILVIVVPFGSAMSWDYYKINRDRETAAALFKSGKGIDFKPGQAFVRKKCETVPLKTLNRIEIFAPANSRNCTRVSPLLSIISSTDSRRLIPLSWIRLYRRSMKSIPNSS